MKYYGLTIDSQYYFVCL